jgi:hypothetical protein
MTAKQGFELFYLEGLETGRMSKNTVNSRVLLNGFFKVKG